MATGFDIFGQTVRDWLEEPDNDEAELESLLLVAASDDYESSQDPAQQSSELSLVVVWLFKPVALSEDIEACRQA